MIPTTASSSPASTPLLALSPNIPSSHMSNTIAAAMSPSSFNNSAHLQKKNQISFVVGIASLILEGRGVPHECHLHQLQQQQPITTNNQSNVQCTNNAFTSNWTACGSGSGSSSGILTDANNTTGRQSPKPSTSKAGGSSSSSNSHMNITTNPHAFGFTDGLFQQQPVSPPMLQQNYHINPTVDRGHERWTQKICQLRQSSPASSSFGTSQERKYAIEVQSGVEPELVSLAINDSSIASERGDFEIVRRVYMNRANVNTANTATTSSTPASSGSSSGIICGDSGGGSCSSGVDGGGIGIGIDGISGNDNFSQITGTDNFLHSLQSLATTCLRGGTPHTPQVVTPASSSSISSNTANNNNNSNSHNMVPNKYNYHNFSARFPTPLNFDTPCVSASCDDFQTPTRSSTVSANIDATTSNAGKSEKLFYGTGHKSAATKAASPPPASPAQSFPQMGPHCEQFLRKMGLTKNPNPDTTDIETHFCDMSYVNITCSRWRAYCHKIEGLLDRKEPICIEVYLGPVSHKVLLEQWIIIQKDKLPPPTMTLPSLCSAIRSQLYFSQISAWCDLIKKSDESIYDTGRIIFDAETTGAAGDLATTSSTNSSIGSVSPSSSSSSSSSSSTSFKPTQLYQSFNNNNNNNSNNTSNNVLKHCRRPRLNIYYRIKKYDETACFNSKPNIHNFPNVNILETCSISVCLKSLPRINGGIPKIIPTTTITPIITKNFKAKTTHNKYMAVGGCSISEQEGETPSSSRGRQTKNCDNSIKKATTSQQNKITMDNAERFASTKIDKLKCHMDNKFATKADNVDKGQKREKVEDDDVDDDDDDEEECDDGEEEDAENDSFKNIFSNGNYANLTHREKQLLKYRKRMMKRDKKQRSGNSKSTSPTHQKQVNTKTHRDDQPMEEGNDEIVVSECTTTSGIFKRRSSQNIEMISTGTQTSMTCCQQCGSEKELICIKCHNNSSNGKGLTYDEDSMDDSSSSSDIVIGYPRNQADRLLAAIQRTPKAAKKHKKQLLRAMVLSNTSASVADMKLPSGCKECKRQKTQHNFDNSVEENINEQQQETDDSCHVETKVLVDNEKKMEPVIIVENVEEEREEIFETEVYETRTKVTPIMKLKCNNNNYNNNNNNNNNSDNYNFMNISQRQKSNYTPPPLTMSPAQKSPQSEFKTPTSSVTTTTTTTPIANMTNGVQHKQTPKPNLLQISTNYANGAFCSLVKLNLPKVNLTPIFCNQTKEHKPHTTIAYSPLATDGGFYFDSNLDVNNIPVQKSNSAPTLPHTPSPHSTSSLSPRFAKQAAIYKKRSRHLSDRSDRSSLGSDEPLSDDELESGGMFSPATSPLKQRVGVIGGHLSRLNAYFNRAPLLGNLEETLLQRRLMPTVEVHGFKVLLGASGGFCPMQLTIPAMAYFYELPGDSLSTPYVCEVRLPRKGYSVPRTGTVQVTLLNPAGTVVRMFVVPYDMRDMPPLHQTFIRQRILADTTVDSTACNIDTVAVQRRNEFKNDNNNNNNNNNTFMNNFNINNNNNSENSCCNGNSSAQKCEGASGDGNNNNNNLGHFISVEHMKRLRYSIHLRFQTSRSGRLSLHTDIRALICRRTDCDTAAAHAKGVFETPSDLITDTVMPNNPKYCSRPDNTTSKI